MSRYGYTQTGRGVLSETYCNYYAQGAGVVISERLRSARQAAHMTQQQVGDRLRPQHTRKKVCKWEHGQTEPSLSTIEQLAAALGVTPCWLAFGCEDRHDDL